MISKEAARSEEFFFRNTRSSDGCNTLLAMVTFAGTNLHNIPFLTGVQEVFSYYCRIADDTGKELL